jgi:glutaredoxin 3
MAPVTIYTTPLCSYCLAAKRLLRAIGVHFIEIDVSNSQDLRAEMVSRSGGGRTVPQIFISGRPIGGSDELHDLYAKGELAVLLSPGQT